LMSEREDDAEDKQSEIVDISSLDTYSLLGMFVGLLTEKAWQAMGLRTKPGTEKIEVDFDQARVAIDTTAFLAEKVQPHLPDIEKRRLEGVVADLKLNYVRLTKTQQK
jgi:hypothetical protein